MPQTRLLIDGRFVDPVERGSIPVLNPATGEKLCDVAAGTSADVDLAVKAARRAFDSGPWGRLSPLERGKLLHGFARLLWEAREELALLESKENGKTWREAVSWDAGPAAAFMSYWAEMPNKVLGEVLPVSGNFHTYVLKEPMGVVGAIVPWNFPSMITAWKLGPALAAGCTVVLKPSELTPLTALMLGHLALEAGVPPGIFNVLP
ncbi:MAG TPA: aldehyde dehydrogenase family protein, partial [Myxococcaceae bacterium]|nr:aldehyde dehydrogenase family protein [Myxococcaceae bacterium]